jgi:5-methylcytosine-specific restriction endonuclease McrA
MLEGKATELSMPTKPNAKPGLYNLPSNNTQRWSANNDLFYHTNRWRKLRIEHFKINPLCVICNKQNRTTLAKVLDHITPVRLGGSIWDSNNHQGLCESCHNSKSALERKQTGRG